MQFITAYSYIPCMISSQSPRKVNDNINFTRIVHEARKGYEVVCMLVCG